MVLRFAGELVNRARALLESGGHLLGWCVVQAFSPTTFVGVDERQQASITFLESCAKDRRNAASALPPRSRHPLDRKGGER